MFAYNPNWIDGSTVPQLITAFEKVGVYIVPVATDVAYPFEMFDLDKLPAKESENRYTTYGDVTPPTSEEDQQRIIGEVNFNRATEQERERCAQIAEASSAFEVPGTEAFNIASAHGAMIAERIRSGV